MMHCNEMRLTNSSFKKHFDKCFDTVNSVQYDKFLLQNQQLEHTKYLKYYSPLSYIALLLPEDGGRPPKHVAEDCIFIYSFYVQTVGLTRGSIKMLWKIQNRTII